MLEKKLYPVSYFVSYIKTKKKCLARDPYALEACSICFRNDSRCFLHSYSSVIHTFIFIIFSSVLSF